MSPPRTPTSLTLHFLRFPRDQDNLYLPTSSFLLGSETPLVQTASKQAGTAHTHESPCRRSYSSTPDGCAVHAVFILRVLLVPDVYTHVSTAARVVSADLGFYTSRRHRACVRHHWHTHFVHDLTVEPRPTTTHLLHLIFRSRRRNGKRMKDSFPRVGYGGGTVIGSVGEMTDPSAYERLPTAEDVVQ